MRKIKEILRLRWSCGLSARQIATSCSIARSTAAECLRRASLAGLSWPLSEGLDDAQLERLLYPPPLLIPAAERALPDWAALRQELKRKGVTLALLWQEYKEIFPEGYQYSRFCELYREWAGKLDLCLRQEHRAGEKLFVDYCGQTVVVVDASSGEVRQAQIFVAVLGASNYTYAEATWSQSLPDWIASHVRAFSYFGGASELVVPDNLKPAITKPCRYEPGINPTYLEMAAHYGTAIVPARAGKPRDKAKVEAGVLLVERWILARLRHQTFFSLAELNEAIAGLLEVLNKRPFKKLPGSRRTLFETLDRPALKPLPERPYEYAEWRKARVNIDYHIEVEGHYYSVPYPLVRQQVEVRLTATTLECLYKGKRVASHVRSSLRGRHTTHNEHMPRSHQRYREWTPSRLASWAAQIGPAAAQVVETIMDRRPHPEQGFRSCLGILRLAKGYGNERLEAACQRALAIDALAYRSLASILKNGLDLQPLPEKTPALPLFPHPNVRGADYYRKSKGATSC